MDHRRWRPAALLVATVLAVAGCGSSASNSTTASAPPPPAPQVFCSGLTDKCVTVGQPAALPGFPALTEAGVPCKIPDVSNWQGHVHWALAKPHVCGGIFKGGEGTGVDAFASDNNSQLSALHMWHALYWFIRAVGCNTEANAIAGEAHRLHVKVVINDLESPADNVGYGACLPPLERKAGLVPVDYTSPGTWSGSAGGYGAVPLWQAEYGPTLHPLWRPVVLWQCTDGHYGCVTSVPGIGVDDVSVNLGITSLGVTHKPADPYAAFPKTVYSFNYRIRAGEYGTVKTWHAEHCANPTKRQWCETLHYHAQLLRDRLVYVAKHEGGYKPYQRGTRLKALNGIVG